MNDTSPALQGDAPLRWIPVDVAKAVTMADGFVIDL